MNDDPLFNKLPYKVLKDLLKKYDRLSEESVERKELVPDIAKNLNAIEENGINLLSLLLQRANIPSFVMVEGMGVMPVEAPFYEYLLELGLMVEVCKPVELGSSRFSHHYAIPSNKLSLVKALASHLETGVTDKTDVIDDKEYLRKNQCDGSILFECKDCKFRFSVLRVNNERLSNYAQHVCVISDRTDNETSHK